MISAMFPNTRIVNGIVIKFHAALLLLCAF